MSNVTVKEARYCRMCDWDVFCPVVDLGLHPLVNNLASKDSLNIPDPVFPLVVLQCDNCGLVQLRDIISGEDIYRKSDYPFYSSDMPALSVYFKEYADDLHRRFLDDAKPGSLVVEIGSNDGLFLKEMSRPDGPNLLGVDPATNVVIRALKNGIPTISDFFDRRLAANIRWEFGPARIVVANNCLAHIDDLVSVMDGVDKLLEKGGVLAVECNYWGEMVRKANYSLIYHDHFSYYSLRTWQLFTELYRMEVFDALTTPAQGGSLRLFIGREGAHRKTDRLKRMETEEAVERINDQKTGHEYGIKVQAAVRRFRETVDGLKKEGKRLAGYGAAAKGMTLLFASGIGKEHLEYFVDDSPAKQGKYSPVHHLPIITRQEAEADLPDYFLILAPNYADVILEKEKDFRSRGGKFVIPLGEEIKIV